MDEAGVRKLPEYGLYRIRVRVSTMANTETAVEPIYTDASLM